MASNFHFSVIASPLNSPPFLSLLFDCILLIMLHSVKSRYISLNKFRSEVKVSCFCLLVGKQTMNSYWWGAEKIQDFHNTGSPCKLELWVPSREKNGPFTSRRMIDVTSFNETIAVIMLFLTSIVHSES